MAADLNFSMRIGVEDGTEAGLQSAMSRFRKFFGGLAGKAFALPFNVGRAGLGILRDVNMGLMPLVRGIDQVIDRGSKLEVIRRGFLNLTGASSKNADIMAKQIVRASSGTMRMAEGMALANRALGAMSFDDLLTAVEFISKKSVATGKDPGEALNTVITGLVRGSTLFLDDFGILVDGAEGVARSFNAIKGSGAFEQLGPAAQKAETIRQALAEMRQQTDKLGVTGKETFFIWSGIQNLIGDGVDKLVLAVAKSDALRNGMTGFAGVLRGVTNLFTDKKNKTPFADLFFGKIERNAAGKEFLGPDGKPIRSGNGLLGLGKAALLDMGELIGRGIAGAFLKGLSVIPELLMAAWNGLTAVLDAAINKIPGKIIEAFQWLKNEFLPALKQTALDIYDDIIGRNASRFSNWMVNEDAQPTWFGKLMGIRGAGEGNRNFKSGFEQIFKPESINDTPPTQPVPEGEAGKKFDEALELYDRLDSERAKDSLQSRAGGRPTGTLVGTALQLLTSSTMALAGVQKSLWELLGESSNKILTGGVLSGEATRTGSAASKFFEEFAQPSKSQKISPVSKPGDLELSPAKRGQLSRRLRQIDLERERLARGDIGIKRRTAARDAADAEIAELRRQGFRVGDRDRARIFETHRRQIIEADDANLKDERRQVLDDLVRDLRVRKARRRQRQNLRRRDDTVEVRQPDFGKMPDDSGAAMYAEEGVALIKQLVEIGNGLLAVLGGGDRQLAAVGGGRA